METTALIFLAFALIHSVTVASWFKRLCTRVLGETFMRAGYRFLFTLVSAATGAAAVYLILQTPDRVLWEAPAWLHWLLRGIQLAGLLFGAQAFHYLDAGEFLGIRQVWRYVVRKEVAGNIEGMTDRELVTTGVYGIVRHPLYAAGLIIFTFSPVFTVNSLTISILADLYFLFGMFIEERRFLRIFGDQYRDYMDRVPRMLPRGLRRRWTLVLALFIACGIAAVLAIFPGRIEGPKPLDQDVLGKIIAQDRQVLATEVAQRFPEWVRAWKGADSRFEPLRMRHELTEQIDASVTTGGGGSVREAGEGDQWLRSPDGTRSLELVDGMEGEPDSELVLIDRERDLRRRLFFYGPAVHINGMQWLENDVVVAVGVDAGTEPTPGTYSTSQPVVWIFRLHDELMSTYTWDLVSRDAGPDGSGGSGE